jgi:hypothetical protein
MDPRMTMTAREVIALDLVLAKVISDGEAPAPIFSLAAKVKDKILAMEKELDAIGGPAADA